MSQVLCDHCKRPIRSLEDGWVQWLMDGRQQIVELTLVHHRGERCMYDAQNTDYDVQDHHARVFVVADPQGVTGMLHPVMYLLSHASEKVHVSPVLSRIRQLAQNDGVEHPKRLA